jgi:hypothetical protein
MMEKDYTDHEQLKAARAEWAEVFALIPKLDMVQIPAGDPGSKPVTPPISSPFSLHFPLLFCSGVLPDRATVPCDV